MSAVLTELALAAAEPSLLSLDDVDIDSASTDQPFAVLHRSASLEHDHADAGHDLHTRPSCPARPSAPPVADVALMEAPAAAHSLGVRRQSTNPRSLKSASAPHAPHAQRRHSTAALAFFANLSAKATSELMVLDRLTRNRHHNHHAAAATAAAQHQGPPLPTHRTDGGSGSPALGARDRSFRPVKSLPVRVADRRKSSGFGSEVLPGVAPLELAARAPHPAREDPETVHPYHQHQSGRQQGGSQQQRTRSGRGHAVLFREAGAADATPTHAAEACDSLLLQHVRTSLRGGGGQASHACHAAVPPHHVGSALAALASLHHSDGHAFEPPCGVSDAVAARDRDLSLSSISDETGPHRSALPVVPNAMLDLSDELGSPAVTTPTTLHPTAWNPAAVVVVVRPGGGAADGTPTRFAAAHQHAAPQSAFPSASGTPHAPQHRGSPAEAGAARRALPLLRLLAHNAASSTVSGCDSAGSAATSPWPPRSPAVDPQRFYSGAASGNSGSAVGSSNGCSGGGGGGGGSARAAPHEHAYAYAVRRRSVEVPAAHKGRVMPIHRFPDATVLPKPHPLSAESALAATATLTPPPQRAAASVLQQRSLRAHASDGHARTGGGGGGGGAAATMVQQRSLDSGRAVALAVAAWRAAADAAVPPLHRPHDQAPAQGNSGSMWCGCAPHQAQRAHPHPRSDEAGDSSGPLREHHGAPDSDGGSSSDTDSGSGSNSGGGCYQLRRSYCCVSPGQGQHQRQRQPPPLRHGFRELAWGEAGDAALGGKGAEGSSSGGLGGSLVAPPFTATQLSVLLEQLAASNQGCCN